MWLPLAFGSAFLLGFYDLFKKKALDNNAVIPVLFLNTVFCSLLFLPVILLSRLYPEAMKDTLLYIPEASLHTHLHIVLKSVIVLSSWLFSYFGVKHLPITIAGPIRATQPVLTLLGALLIFGEQLNGWQWTGVSISLFSFYVMSLAGKKEGIRFTHNKWIWFMFLSIIVGATSGLYDKYLMARFDRMVVQAWYNYYQMGMMAVILLVLWYPRRKTSTPFTWNYSIFFISLFLVIADFVYFYALSQPGAMISVISMIRRSCVVISFLGGVMFFHEKNIGRKTIDLILVIIGMIFLYFGSK